MLFTKLSNKLTLYVFNTPLSPTNLKTKAQLNAKFFVLDTLNNVTQQPAVLIMICHMFVVWFFQTAIFVFLSGNNSRFPETNIQYHVFKHEKRYNEKLLKIQLCYFYGRYIHIEELQNYVCSFRYNYKLRFNTKLKKEFPNLFLIFVRKKFLFT